MPNRPAAPLPADVAPVASARVSCSCHNEIRGYILADRSEQRRIIEEVVRLLESARLDPAEGLDFDDKRVESYLVSALSAARSALNIAARRENPADGPR